MAYAKVACCPHISLIFCANALSKLNNYVMNHQIISGFHFIKGGAMISHFMFADDLLIVGQAKA